MCTAVFLPLGLPANHPFWTEPYSEWTNLKAWKGVDVGADLSLIHISCLICQRGNLNWKFVLQMKTDCGVRVH